MATDVAMRDLLIYCVDKIHDDLTKMDDFQTLLGLFIYDVLHNIVVFGGIIHINILCSLLIEMDESQ